MNENEIIIQCKNGNLKNFSLLFDEYKDKIYRFIYFKTQHKETAEDLLSQTFIKALEHINQINIKKGSFKNWIYTIARNNVTDFYRKYKEMKNNHLLEKSCKIILKQCMNLKKNESCLIVTDSKLKSIGNALYKNSLKITKQSKLILTTIPKAHGEEPPQKIADEMLKHDVILMPTTKSLSHTKARENAIKTGARIASMPSITTDMMNRALNVDFNKIKSINKKLILSIWVNLKNSIQVRFKIKMIFICCRNFYYRLRQKIRKN